MGATVTWDLTAPNLGYFLANHAEESRSVINVMAKNPPIGDNARKGAVKDRSQTYNPTTDHWTKRDAESGKFMDQKADDKPFKGVRKEK